MAQYDLVVLGAGPGGYVAAIRAAHLGLKTAIVEKDAKLGGTCLLRGCIPTKALLHSADVLSEISHAKDFGVIATGQVDMAGVQKARSRAVDKSAAGVTYLMKQNKIDVHTGRGRLTGPHTVLVEGKDGAQTTLEAKFIVLATGSVPKKLPFLPVDGKHVVTSDEILELTSVPKRLLVLGAGAVGVEFASVYSRFGADVTVVEMLERALPIEDEEVSAALEREMKKQKIALHLGTKVEDRKDNPDGSITLTLAGGRTVDVDAVLVATGRRPYSEGLGLAAAGLATGERGRIVVDDHLRTSVKNIFAIGDVTDIKQLAHFASAQGKAAVEIIAGHAAQTNWRAVPAAPVTSPEIASVGMTETQA
jgi:dihydrolipoamide dehydrogenase